MKQILFLIALAVSQQLVAQTDTVSTGTMIVHSDFRLQILARKELELNATAARNLERSAMGYRLQVLSTNDKELAFKTRTQLLQKFPEQKVYMYFQAPYVKLKFGNFKSKQEADIYKAQVSRMLGGISIYFLSERIEIKPEKDLNLDPNNK